MDKKTTREQVGEFHTLFRAPIRTELTALSVSEQLLRGNLLLEEVLEYFKACGLYLTIKPDAPSNHMEDVTDELVLEHQEGWIQDPVEMADGLGDINYIIHGTAHCMGIDLDAVTTEIHDSNMSKLGSDGQPIINQCMETHTMRGQVEACEISCHLIDSRFSKGQTIASPTSPR
jgi:predicted HAD superfamily Cof-like phosphohydrolase